VRVCVNRLESGLKEILDGVPLTGRPDLRSFDSLVRLLDRYCDEIERFNPAYGLVSVKDRDELVVKHILDSLAPIRSIMRLAGSRSPENTRIADVGSGAGLPGIPLAIALPGTSFTLIERTGRRAGFLRNTAAVMELANVEILELEMEKAPPGIADAVCFRAFSRLEPKILKKMLRLLKPKGCIIAYKGRSETACAEILPMADFLRQRNSPWSVIPCRVPFLDDERNIVLIGG
jgi:16S rRNA (guanine527-N7)-methyltransferase